LQALHSMALSFSRTADPQAGQIKMFSKSCDITFYSFHVAK
jgi:hypothetical protein